jgi:hypothetical protein
MTYCAYAHSIMSYGIIFWGNSTHSNQIFKIQKRIVSIIMKAWNKDSCGPLFRLLTILPFYSQYMLSISIFVVKNMDIFISNSDIHSSIHTRQGLHLHFPTYKPLLWHMSYFTTCFGPHGPSSSISYKNAKRLLYAILSDPLSLHTNKAIYLK